MGNHVGYNDLWMSLLHLHFTTGCKHDSLILCVLPAAIIGDVRTSMMEEVDFNKEAQHIQEVGAPELA